MLSLKRLQGFTLIELMLVLVVAGVLIAVAVPSFQGTIKSNRLTTSTNELIGAINFARSEAARRGSPVHFRPGSGTSGGIVWIDGDTANVPGESGDVEVRRWPAPPSGVTITAAHTFYIFSGSGIVDKQGTFTVCDDRSGETGSEIKLLVSGSVNRSPQNCS